ncbi:MAG: hypothetical protein H6825_14860 [Planctomycetes bacterium]|nr:hypothetical protein [Planctomycetota bacterium]
MASDLDEQLLDDTPRHAAPESESVDEPAPDASLRTLLARIALLAAAAFGAFGLLRMAQFAPRIGPWVASAGTSLVLLVPVAFAVGLGLPRRVVLRVALCGLALGFAALELAARLEEADFRAVCERLDVDAAPEFKHAEHRGWPFDAYVLRCERVDGVRVFSSGD